MNDEPAVASIPLTEIVTKDLTTSGRFYKNV